MLYLTGCAIRLKVAVTAECDFMEPQKTELAVIDEIAQKAPWSDGFWDWLNRVQTNEELRVMECENG